MDVTDFSKSTANPNDNKTHFLYVVPFLSMPLDLVKKTHKHRGVVEAGTNSKVSPQRILCLQCDI